MGHKLWEINPVVSLVSTQISPNFLKISALFELSRMHITRALKISYRKLLLIASVNQLCALSLADLQVYSAEDFPLIENVSFVESSTNRSHELVTYFLSILPFRLKIRDIPTLDCVRFCVEKSS